MPLNQPSPDKVARMVEIRRILERWAIDGTWGEVTLFFERGSIVRYREVKVTQLEKLAKS